MPQKKKVNNSLLQVDNSLPQVRKSFPQVSKLFPQDSKIAECLFYGTFLGPSKIVEILSQHFEILSQHVEILSNCSSLCKC